MSKKILLIGAGPTSSLIAYKLKQVGQKLKFPLEVHLWEKSKGTGGRFSTSRSPHNEKIFADLGAQYLTQTNSNTWSQPYFTSLKENGLIRQFLLDDVAGFKRINQEDKDNFVCLQGTAAVVKFFLSQANISSTHFNRKVVEITLKDCDDGVKRIEVIGEQSQTTEKQAELFDVVILTVPVPQILQLQNANTLVIDSDMRANLSRVTYTSRFALGLFYDTSVFLKSGEKAVNYVDNDPVLRYWTLENEKRKMGSSESADEFGVGSAVVIHTSVQFGAANVEKSLQEMEKVLLNHIDGKIKTIKDIPPKFVKCHKWRYSQVDKAYPDSPGFLQISNSPILLAAGDGFTHSGFEGCILSAEKTVQQLVTALS